MKVISMRLFSRGMHRMFGNPSLGTFSGFLTVMFLIRAAVNLYYVCYMSSGETRIDILQISNNWFLFSGAYFISCSSLSAFHIGFALPDRSFLELSSGAVKFKSIFIKQAVCLRPMNLVVILLSVSGLFVFSIFGGYICAAAGILIISASVAGAYIIYKLIGRLSLEMLDVQIIETAFLATLIMLNPDVIQHGGRVVMLLYNRYFPFDDALPVVLSFSVLLTACAAVLLLVKGFSLLSRTFKVRKYHEPMQSWYWHFFKIKFWIILYLLMLPLLFIPAFSVKLKLQAAAVYLLFTLISYLFFVNHCANAAREKWRIKFLSGKNIKLAIPPFIVHIILTLLPLSGLLLR